MSFPYYKNAAGMGHLFCVELIDHLWVSHYLNYVALLFMTMIGLGIARDVLLFLSAKFHRFAPV